MKNTFSDDAASLVSIIVPVSNDIEGLRVTLQSLSHLVTSSRYEVIVCNDGGSALVSELASKYHCIEARLSSNLGSYAARNAGLRVAKGNVIAFLDADQTVDPGWLDAGTAALQRADYAGGKVVVVSDREDDAWIRFDMARAFPVEQYLQHGFAPTANLFVHRSVLTRVSPFVESLRSGGDYEFGQRVKAAGLRQLYAEGAITYHPARDRRQQFSKERRVMFGVAETKIRIEKQHWLSLAGAALRVLLQVPIELVWRLARLAFTRSPEPDALAFLVIEKMRKAVRSFWLFSASVTLGIGKPLRY